VAVAAAADPVAWRTLVLGKVAELAAADGDPCGGPSGDLVRALAWTATRGPAGVPVSGPAALQLADAEHQPGRRPVVNPVQWPACVRWFRALEVAIVDIVKGKECVVIDAATAVQWALDDLAPGQLTSSEAALDLISSRLPWLHGGAASVE